MAGRRRADGRRARRRRGGVIEALTPGAAPPPGAVRLAGVTLPGLANAHSHAFHRALRGRTQVGPGTFWTWRDEMYRAGGRPRPRRVPPLARAVFGEMVLAGVTCVGEFHYVHHQPDGTHYADPNAMGAAIVAAAADAGLRLTLLDTCYLGAGLEPDRSLRTPSRSNDGSTTAPPRRGPSGSTRLATSVSSATVRIGAAVHSVRAVDAGVDHHGRGVGSRTRPPAARPRLRAAGRERAVPRRARAQPGRAARVVRRAVARVHRSARHAHRRRRRQPAGRARRGRVPVPDHRARPRRRDRPDGAVPRRRRSRSSLGSDSHAVIDLFEEARAVELDERLATGTRGNHGVRDLAAGRDRGRPPVARLAGVPAGSRSARPPTWSPSPSARCAPPARRRATPWRRWCSRRPPPT